VKFDRRTLLVAGGVLAGSAAVGSRIAFANAPIRIGATLPLSGGSQLIGNNHRLGIEIARDQINAAGGVGGRPLEILFRDDKGDPNQAVANARELSADGVTMLIGPSLSAQNVAVIQIIESLNMVQMTPSSPLLSLTHELYSRNFFRGADNDHMRARTLARVMAERFPNVKKWSGIVLDVAVGHASWAHFSAGLKEFYPQIANTEVEVLDVATAKFGSTDFRTQIFRLMQSGAEGVYNLTFGADMVTMWNQAKTLGLSDKVSVVADGGGGLNLPTALGKNMPPQMWSNVHWNIVNPNGNALHAELLAEIGRRTSAPFPPDDAASGHSAVHSFAAAVKAADSVETQAIIEALESVEIDTVMGKASFRKEDHQRLSPVNILGSAPTESGVEFKSGVEIAGSEVVEAASPGVEYKI